MIAEAGPVPNQRCPHLFMKNLLNCRFILGLNGLDVDTLTLGFGFYVVNGDRSNLGQAQLSTRKIAGQGGLAISYQYW